ncbi:hypothetical protein K504DRAFT_459670 [Pleomassaria siparia CBS 279.74]|uniref:Uncharacterized protein n=1 Tax=Pleomassaria siparia CBS 279.74 TaxID=1314801 RepID=A0A6G1K0P7_9PLEO|nr:hypothetical protein K504DRAFT_459670 [Pleomassaria siparia CBS 279.74]
MDPTSPTLISHPIPRRTLEDPQADLRHPTPDLQTLQGAYVGNIERLEEHAERLSERGSDLGEEIRKLQIEQKLSDSRRSSLLSGSHVDEPVRHFSNRSRNASTGSYTNSIVDVNGQARWGGYSPTAYVGSHASGSFTQRQRSGSRASRLGQVVHMDDNDEAPGSPADFPRTVPTVPGRNSSPPAPNQRAVSSFTLKYNQIAQEIQDGLQLVGDQQQESENMQQVHYQNQLDLPDRPPTAASTDTTHQARTLWQDFDGVHCPDTVPEEEPTLPQGTGSRNSSLLKMAPEPSFQPQAAPPPDDGMVFYPAPVPKMLNLPKRLSQLPASNVQARRRTQLLESMQAENRMSAPWLADASLDKQNRKSMDARKSRQSLANLPPQLRASAYFDQIGQPSQEFEVKGASAEDTLDSILEASAHAPVSAFTDHPFAGHMGEEVYGKEQNRRYSKINQLDKVEARKSRNSLHLLDTRRNSSGELLNKLKKRNSSADLNVLTIRAAELRMSMAGELDNVNQDDRDHEPGDDDDRVLAEDSVDGEDTAHPDNNLEEEEQEPEEELEEQYFGPPTTLLAELQMRKQQQKTRNLTAATAFPNGMRATLLELDAVAEIEKNKRKGQKVNLAWEAQQLHDDDDDSDDDVPLGVLFPGRGGLVNKRAGANQQHVSDWDRPLGLIAQREIEDNEPLSRRRNRLVGADVGKPRDPSPEKRHDYLSVPMTTTPGPESEEDEGETLAQRIRRLKNRQALDEAIGADVRKSTVSGDFAAEMMNQFGVPEEEEKPKPSPSPEPDEEETLGQRRARLQAEAMATRPPMRGSMSMADILAAHPIDTTNQAHKVSDEMLLASMPQNSLLHQNAKKQDRLKADRLEQTRRISSFGSLDRPLLGEHIGKGSEELPIAAKIAAFKNQMSGGYTPNTAPGSVPSMMFNGHMMGGMSPAMSNMNIPGQRDSHFPQANMGMAGAPYGMNNGMAMTPNGYGIPASNMNMMPQQMMPTGMMGGNGMQGMGYPYPQMGGMAGAHSSSMINIPGHMPMTALQMQQMMDQPMDPRQRDMVDRWRQSVMY